MAEPSNIGFERLNDAFRNLDDQLQELRERFDDQLRRVENSWNERREELRDQVRKTALYKRSEQVRKDFEEQVDRGRAQLYDAFGIASKSEIQKLSRKLNTLSKKLSELARDQVVASEDEPQSEPESEQESALG